MENDKWHEYWRKHKCRVQWREVVRNDGVIMETCVCGKRRFVYAIDDITKWEDE